MSASRTATCGLSRAAMTPDNQSSRAGPARRRLGVLDIGNEITIWSSQDVWAAGQ